jgi:hypothetical protein
MNSDEAKSAIARLETLHPNNKQGCWLLPTPRGIWPLMDMQTVTLVENFPPEQQARILAARGAVPGLADDGQSARTCAIIERLLHEQQAMLFASPAVAWSLADNGHAASILGLIEKLLPDQQASVLRLAMPCLVWPIAAMLRRS